MAATNPALDHFIAVLPQEGAFEFGQVCIQRIGASGFSVRHTDDARGEEGGLKRVGWKDLRQLAQFNGSGAFRPLRGAPDLVSGWIYTATTPQELEEGLQALYPGSLADWHSAHSAAPEITHYRPYVERQTGMYRITAMLSDADAARAATACCAREFCLKQRLWTVPGLPADEVAGKSSIPCLEPCSPLMEFARKTFRIQEEPEASATLKPSELESIRSALQYCMEHPSGGRAADFGDCLNPRRLKLLLDRLPEAPSSGHAKS